MPMLFVVSAISHADMFPSSVCPAHATSSAACIDSIHAHAKMWTDAQHLTLADEPNVAVSSVSAELAHVRHRGLLFGVDADALERSEQHRGSMLASLAPVPVLQNATIVLDAANICMRYGDGKSFVTAGLARTIAWFGARGHRCIACVPDYVVRVSESSCYFGFIRSSSHARESPVRFS